jgi:hypothetical protein
MATDPRTSPDDPDKGVEDALSGFNAEEILEDPDELDPEHDNADEGLAATPDSPNPI